MTGSPVQTTIRLPEHVDRKLKRFEQAADQFQEGRISASAFHAQRVLWGVYEERQDSLYMLRIRLPGGVISAHQARVIAQAARQYASPTIHVTTRQDVQLHQVLLKHILLTLTSLLKAELHNWGSGGNAVRNVTACSHAGFCLYEHFDVTPFAVALTDFFLSDPSSTTLPRKFKVAFAGCSRDCSGSTVSDLGFIAKTRDGEKGFAVYVGGGMGAKPRIADRLEEFIPVADVFAVAEAVKRVFDLYGDRENRHKARLRFLIEKIGLTEFTRRYRTELETIRNTIPPRPEPPEKESGCSLHVESRPSVELTEVFLRWKARHHQPQKQKGMGMVSVPLFLGQISADQLSGLAEVAEAFGECVLRTTIHQNFVILNVRDDQLHELFLKLDQLGLADGDPSVAGNLVACVGASTCRLGLCRSQDLARAIVDRLAQDRIDPGDLPILISGCPNACARHWIAPIGLSGVLRKEDGQSVPHYRIHLGGKVEEGETRFGREQATLPADQVPEFLSNLLKEFGESRDYPDFYGFLRAREVDN